MYSRIALLTVIRQLMTVTGFRGGFKGRFISNGSNYRPASHDQAGKNIASQIMPLDTAGNIDLVNGKIVWLSIGMSNTTQESQVCLFSPFADLWFKRIKLVS